MKNATAIVWNVKGRITSSIFVTLLLLFMLPVVFSLSFASVRWAAVVEIVVPSMWSAKR